MPLLHLIYIVTVIQHIHAPGFMNRSINIILGFIQCYECFAGFDME